MSTTDASFDVLSKAIDLNSVDKLPETHMWASQVEDQPFLDSNNLENFVPIIDLNEDNATELIGYACRAWGVFHVLNHGIPKTLLDEVEAAGKRLFSLPMERKLKAARPPGGLSGYGSARISSFFPKRMWSEGFTIAGCPVENARKLWPDDYHQFCETVEEYQKAMKALARRLLWLMLGSLGVTRDDLEWAAAPESGYSALQMNSYPTCPDPDRAMGLAAHTDSTILTILHQSNTSGLQVLREGSSRWTTVPPLPGALVVHVGDLLHMMSNGAYPSVVHRARVNQSTPRLSVGYFYGPPSSVSIGPIAKLVDSCHPAMYRPVTWAEYLKAKAQYFDKALTSVRMCAPRTGGGFGNANDKLIA